MKSIIIRALDNPKTFVERWSDVYNYSVEYKYAQNISIVLENRNSFIELFRWKNGTGNNIAKGKFKAINEYYDKIDVLKKLQEKFDWDEFENKFEPEKSATIWKIFLLHLINPGEFPIYDQHVSRFYNFCKTGEIRELPNKYSDVYQSYKNDYKPWFTSYKIKNRLRPKKMDEAFFVFGKLLKKIKSFPIDVV